MGVWSFPTLALFLFLHLLRGATSSRGPVLDLNGPSAKGRDYAVYSYSPLDETIITSSRLFLSNMSGPILWASVHLTATLNGQYEKLVAQSTDNINSTYTSDTQELYISGPDKVSEFEKILRTVRYVNRAPSRTKGRRFAVFTLSNGVSNASAVSMISVEAQLSSSLPCSTFPCKNGARCTDIILPGPNTDPNADSSGSGSGSGDFPGDSYGFVCFCTGGWTGTDCSIPDFNETTTPSLPPSLPFFTEAPLASTLDVGSIWKDWFLAWILPLFFCLAWCPFVIFFIWYRRGRNVFHVRVQLKTDSHPVHPLVDNGCEYGYEIRLRRKGRWLAGRTLHLYRGRRYRFIMDNVDIDFPFYITYSDVGGENGVREYLHGVQRSPVWGRQQLIFTVPYDAPPLLYYQCSKQKCMGNMIFITDVGEDKPYSPAQLTPYTDRPRTPESARPRERAHASTATGPRRRSLSYRAPPSYAASLRYCRCAPIRDLVAPDYIPPPHYHRVLANRTGFASVIEIPLPYPLPRQNTQARPPPARDWSGGDSGGGIDSGGGSGSSWTGSDYAAQRQSPNQAPPAHPVQHALLILPGDLTPTSGSTPGSLDSAEYFGRTQMAEPRPVVLRSSSRGAGGQSMSTDKSAGSDHSAATAAGKQKRKQQPHQQQPAPRVTGSTPAATATATAGSQRSRRSPSRGQAQYPPSARQQRLQQFDQEEEEIRYHDPAQELYYDQHSGSRQSSTTATNPASSRYPHVAEFDDNDPNSYPSFSSSMAAISPSEPNLESDADNSQRFHSAESSSSSRRQ